MSHFGPTPDRPRVTASIKAGCRPSHLARLANVRTRRGPITGAYSRLDRAVNGAAILAPVAGWSRAPIIIAAVSDQTPEVAGLPPRRGAFLTRTPALAPNCGNQCAGLANRTAAGAGPCHFAASEMVAALVVMALFGIALPLE